MKRTQLIALIQKITAAVEKRIPEYLGVQADFKLNEGNCALCIVDDTGEVHGKMFGSDKVRQRNCFRIAWIKASQVWITGLRTGEFEKRVYAGEIDEHLYGIIRPDFIGWEGGQPISLDAQTKLSVGFSGFRGTSDLEIVRKAVGDVLGKQ
jgi:uncharacterized protein GlcG (DUF336 family)